MSEMAERIEEALARIEDFEAVQRGAGPEGPADAVLCLQASVGIDDEARLALREGLERSDRSGQPGPIFMGLSGTQAITPRSGTTTAQEPVTGNLVGAATGRSSLTENLVMRLEEREVVAIAAAGVSPSSVPENSN